MDDRRHFAAQVLANQLGVLGKQEVIAAADLRLIETDKPEPWLIDLSVDGNSAELSQLITCADDAVFRDVLRLCFREWSEGRISDKRFVACCSTLWKTAGERSVWYQRLIPIEDDFDLIEQGVFERAATVERVKAAVAKILKE
jgi:hypothetical protein